MGMGNKMLSKIKYKEIVMNKLLTILKLNKYILQQSKHLQLPNNSAGLLKIEENDHRAHRLLYISLLKDLISNTLPDSPRVLQLLTVLKDTLKLNLYKWDSDTESINEVIDYMKYQEIKIEYTPTISELLSSYKAIDCYLKGTIN